MIGNGELVLRLVLAIVCGGIIGYQRERAERPAGFRTHVLVCLGAALFTLISIYPFFGKTYADPSRIASQVVVGIGFLGAGAIIRQGNIVIGLTTAASLWAIAAVGLAIGSGYYVAGLATTLLILIVLVALKVVETSMMGVKDHFALKIRAADSPGQLGDIGQALGKLKVNIRGVDLTSEEVGEEAMMDLILDLPADLDPTEVIKKLVSVKGVKACEWESEPRRQAKRKFPF